MRAHVRAHVTLIPAPTVSLAPHTYSAHNTLPHPQTSVLTHLRTSTSAVHAHPRTRVLTQNTASHSRTRVLTRTRTLTRSHIRVLTLTKVRSHHHHLCPSWLVGSQTADTRSCQENRERGHPTPGGGGVGGGAPLGASHRREVTASRAGRAWSAVRSTPQVLPGHGPLSLACLSRPRFSMASLNFSFRLKLHLCRAPGQHLLDALPLRLGGTPTPCPTSPGRPRGPRRHQPAARASSLGTPRGSPSTFSTRTPPTHPGIEGRQEGASHHLLMGHIPLPPTHHGPARPQAEGVAPWRPPGLLPRQAQTARRGHPGLLRPLVWFSGRQRVLDLPGLL